MEAISQTGLRAGDVAYTLMGKMKSYDFRAFVFVAEFEIRLPGTNADVKYKSSLFIPLLN